MNSKTPIIVLKKLLEKTNISRLEDPPQGVPRYKIDNFPYFSVTQILDDGRFDLVDQTKLFHSKIVGAVVHNFVDNFFKNKDLNYKQNEVLRPDEFEYLNNLPVADKSEWQDFKDSNANGVEEIFLKNKIQASFDQFINFYEENDVELIFTEEPLWCPKFLYAGTIDLLCKLNGHLAIVDHKTSKFIKSIPRGFDNYTAQLSAYSFALKNLLNENFDPECYILHLNPFADGYQIIRRAYKFSMFLDSLSRFSGGNPSLSYIEDTRNKYNRNNKIKNTSLSRSNNEKESIKEIKFKCIDVGCNETSSFYLTTSDLSLNNNGIKIIPKCSYHESGNHYHLLHLKTETWKTKENFVWNND